jgi:hypothetical protein
VGWVGRCRWLPDYDGKARQVRAPNYIVQVVAHEHDELAAIPPAAGGSSREQNIRSRAAAGSLLAMM